VAHLQGARDAAHHPLRRDRARPVLARHLAGSARPAVGTDGVRRLAVAARPAAGTWDRSGPTATPVAG
jgi:hypothetical protein